MISGANLSERSREAVLTALIALVFLTPLIANILPQGIREYLSLLFR